MILPVLPHSLQLFTRVAVKWKKRSTWCFEDFIHRTWVDIDSWRPKSSPCLILSWHLLLKGLYLIREQLAWEWSHFRTNRILLIHLDTRSDGPWSQFVLLSESVIPLLLKPVWLIFFYVPGAFLPWKQHIKVPQRKENDEYRCDYCS